jgi:hypothetical protein
MVKHKNEKIAKIAILENDPAEKEIYIKGFLKTLREVKTKNGNILAFGKLGSLEDSGCFRDIDLIFFSRIWDECRYFLKLNDNFMFKGSFTNYKPGNECFKVSRIVSKEEFESCIPKDIPIIIDFRTVIDYSHCISKAERSILPSIQEFFKKELGIELQEEF